MQEENRESHWAETEHKETLWMARDGIAVDSWMPKYKLS